MLDGVTEHEGPETALWGGQTAGVVRVGETVRRPARANTPAIHAALEYLRARGAAWVPDVLGIDDDGRETLRWAPGEATWVRHRDHWGTHEAITRVGGLVREMHDLFAEHDTADGDHLLTHGDLGPWNVVVSPGGAVTVIDWDSLGLRHRLWEVAHAAWAFVPLMDRNETDAIGWADGAPDHAGRLATFFRGYGLDRSDVGVVLDNVVALCDKASENENDDGRAANTNRSFVVGHRAQWRTHLEAALR